jgi:hypothetical protein
VEARECLRTKGGRERSRLPRWRGAELQGQTGEGASLGPGQIFEVLPDGAGIARRTKELRVWKRMSGNSISPARCSMSNKPRHKPK